MSEWLESVGTANVVGFKDWSPSPVVSQGRALSRDLGGGASSTLATLFG